MNVSVIISAFIVIEGVYALITGRMIGNNGRALDKYTEASYTKYCRIVGVIFVILGAIFVAIDFLPDSRDNLLFILIGAAIVALICTFVSGKIILVKSGSSKEKGSSDRYIDED